MTLTRPPIVVCLLLVIGLASSFSPLVQQRSSREFVNSPLLRKQATNQATFPPSSTRLFVSSSETSGDASTLNYVSSSAPPPSPRRIARMEKFARLPVWPVWNGVAIFVISRIFGEEVAAKLEDSIGGRVCPNFFSDDPRLGTTSPFIMLVHHRHSFAAWDVLRYIQRTFFPEGFPAHPHRGFVTVTYILKGGFRHRDSLGIKQMYGAEERHGGKHTQWLTTGGGMLHEEMFDMGEENFFKPADQELYQLWLNLPSQDKLMSPRIDLLGGEEETPTVKVTNNDGKCTETIIIAGDHGGKTSGAPIRSDVAIMHVKMESGTEWHHELPASHETAVIYVRRGSIQVDGQRVPPHHTAYLATQGSLLSVVAAEEDGADFLLLAGQPIREPVAAQGSMVMNTPGEIDDAYADYQRGAMGLPWNEGLLDDDWMAHVKQYPSRYNTNN